MNGFGKARKASKLTQQRVSELTGIPLSTLRRWEQGVNEPDVASMVKLAELYGCSTDVLLESKFADRYVYKSDEYVMSVMNKDERMLLECFRSCTPQYREMLIATARSFRDSSKASTAASRSLNKAVNE